MKKKREKAVGLRYKEDKENAPKVVAKGYGEIAKNIIEKAKEHNVPLYYDPDLTQALINLELAQQIPNELYKIVARVLAFVYLLDDKYKDFKE